MAAGQHNPSRRALLGAVVALPLVGSAAPPESRLQSSGQTANWTPDQVRGDGRWERALARLEAAEAEVRAVERATAGKPAEEEEGLQEVYDARLGDHTAALLRLMKVRAPDLPALALKIELAIDQEVGTLSGGDVCLAMLKRDVRRLMK
jgi:hypothetical protein